jgi:eukaryotic-like serine/threonine-protein kinase
MELAPGSFIGKYVVVRKIGEGGMAEIYLATHKGPEGFERELCIKRIREFLSNDPHFVEMFVAEARIAANLSHPNIVQVFDFDRTWDAYYIAMEFVNGKSLSDIRHRAREKMQPIPPLLAAHITHEVAKGLAHAHGLRNQLAPTGVVHRDVTPHNVLISYSGDVKLTDFGIAKMGSRASTSGSIKGKFAYMSPEQARGEEVDPRTDVFALGIVLWEMLTGGRLFEGDGDTKIIKAVQEAAIVPPTRLNTDVPDDLSDLVMQALERPLDKRFPDAHQMAVALRRLLFAHAKETTQLDLADYMKALFGDPSEHTNVVSGRARSGDTARLPEKVPAKKNPDDDPVGATFVRSGPQTEPPPLEEGNRPSRETVSGRPRNVGAPKAEETPRSVELSAVEAPPPKRSFIVPVSVAILVAGASLLGYQVLRTRSAATAAESPPAVDAPSLATRPAGAGAPSPAPASATDVAKPSPPLSSPPPAPGPMSPTTLPETEPLLPPPKPAEKTDAPKTASSKRPKAAEGKKGIIKVTVSPWGTVFIDGTEVGEGPAQWPVSPGSHSVRVVNGETRAAKTVRVNVGSGQLIDVDGAK